MSTHLKMRVCRPRTATTNLAGWASSNYPLLLVTGALWRETLLLSQGYRQDSTQFQVLRGAPTLQKPGGFTVVDAQGCSIKQDLKTEEIPSSPAAGGNCET
ncbi:hypothetical protein K438DRAFT_1777424 [Mycena galopus ATCC 62051]|nr:hypothetical protein K438DRAFT_1777424 [Mycena galopus ATCC 62051]